MKRLLQANDNLLPTTAPCAKCGTDVELQPAAAELAVQLSKMLIALGERPLGDNELVYCDKCGLGVEAGHKADAQRELDWLTRRNAEHRERVGNSNEYKRGGKY